MRAASTLKKEGIIRQHPNSKKLNQNVSEWEDNFKFYKADSK